jgi:Raf kinase inhibitor-like YbhB/YbcL family protein
MKCVLALLAIVGLSVMPLTAQSAQSDGKLAIYQVNGIGDTKLDVESTAFQDGMAIPAQYSSYGKNISPPIAWSPGPAGTKSYVLIVEDPAAPMPMPMVHWLVYNISPGVLEIKEGGASAKGELMEGKNGTGSVGYFGPKPPPGDNAHPYHFQVFALNDRLDLQPGADRNAVVAAMNGHVLGVGELVGVYQKSH